MLKKLFLLIIVPILLQSQDFNNYKPITCVGTIPDFFIKKSSDAFEEDLNKINNKDKKFDRKAEKQFHLINSFSTHELLYSGKIVYNDVLSNYANEILKKILQSNPQLDKNISVFITKSYYVNAFALDNGIILINEGLIAQLETEAQFAFILCHELVHYIKKHNKKSYVYEEKVKNNKTEKKLKYKNDKIFEISKYSQETEKEADLEGLEYFKNTNYSLNKITGVFDVLEYSYLPFDEIKYDRNFLEYSNLKFPDTYYPEKIKDLPTTETDEDHKLSSHPSSSARRTYIEKKLNNENNENRKEFIVKSKSDFDVIQKIARFEITEEYIQDRKFAEALYCIFLLEKTVPNSNYLNQAKAKCLYGISKYKMSRSYSEIETNYEEVYGESQPLHHLLSNLQNEEITTYTLKYLWSLKQNNSTDNFYNDILVDLIKDMSIYVFNDLSNFSKTVKKEIVATPTSDSLSDSKYDKIRKKVSDNPVNTNYYEYALVDELNNSDLQNFYEKIAKEEIAIAQLKKDKKYRKKLLKEENKIKRRGYKLGIDKVIVANPYYLHVDKRKKNQIQFLHSEDKSFNFLESINKNATLNKVETIVIDDIDVQKMNTDKFNDFNFLNSWLENYSKNKDDNTNLINVNKEKTSEIIKKYGTKYAVWIGTINLRHKKTFYGLGHHVFVSIIFPYYAPFGIFQLIKPDYETFYYALVFDLEKQELVMKKTLSMSQNDTNDQINSLLYDTFYQINSKK